jgi:hypothetical protein
VIASPLRLRVRQESGIAAAGQLAHPKNALRRFTLVRDHNASTASSRPALTEARPRNQPRADRPVNSGPRPCLIDVGFPLSGPQDRTFTSDLNAMPGTPATPSGLRSAAGSTTTSAGVFNRHRWVSFQPTLTFLNPCSGSTFAGSWVTQARDGTSRDAPASHAGGRIWLRARRERLWAPSGREPERLIPRSRLHPQVREFLADLHDVTGAKLAAVGFRRRGNGCCYRGRVEGMLPAGAAPPASGLRGRMSSTNTPLGVRWPVGLPSP